MKISTTAFEKEFKETSELNVGGVLGEREKQQELFRRLVTEVTSSQECDDVDLEQITECLVNANGYSGGSFEDEQTLGALTAKIILLKNMSYVNRVV